MKSRSSSSLFLIELIIALLFFSVCAAICVNIFAKSALMAKNARESENAVLLAENAAAAYKSAGGDMDKTAALLGGSCDSGSVSASYDENCSAAEDDSVYFLTIIPDDDSPYYTGACITVCANSGGELFSMNVGAMGGGAQ